MADKSLVDFVTELKGESHLRIEHDYGDGFVRLHTSEAERRQAAQDIQCSEDIVVELLRNARDAHASHIFMAVCKEQEKRTICVLDDGDGIPASMHENVFKPRVTSKLDTSHKDAWGLHGRGMALFSIAQNSLEAQVVASDVRLGTSVRVLTDTTVLREKKDQSSFPLFIMDDEGTVNVRGPKNIVRTACEFAIETRNECSLTLGSPAEIACSLYSYGKATLSAVDRAFCKDASTLPLVKRLAIASDAREFALIAHALGLSVSERTARRIMDDELVEPQPLLAQIRIDKPAASARRAKRSNRRKAPLQRDEAARLAEAVCDAFKPLAERYYLEEDVSPSVRVGADKLTITVPLVEKVEKHTVSAV